MLPKFWTALATSLWGGRGGIDADADADADADVDIDVNDDDGSEKSSLLSSVVFSILIFILFSCAVDNAEVDGMLTIFIRYLFIVTVRSDTINFILFWISLSLSLVWIQDFQVLISPKYILITRSGKDQKSNQHPPETDTTMHKHTDKCVTETRIIVD